MTHPGRTPASSDLRTRRPDISPIQRPSPGKGPHVGSSLRLARATKHRLMLARRRINPAVSRTGDAAYHAWDHLHPWSYDPGSMTASFVSRRPKVSAGDQPSVPSRIYVLWTGDNPMSGYRAARLANIRGRLDVELITPANLSEWVLDEAPLHPTYEHLSLVHRADYLRAYLMRHHGGAYLDINGGFGDIPAAVERLNSSPDLWMAGCREPGAATVAADSSATLALLRRRHRNVIGMYGFAARPGSPLTVEWLDEVNSLLDGYADQLHQHPGDAMGQNPGYPIPWTRILGSVLPPSLPQVFRPAADRRGVPAVTDELPVTTGSRVPTERILTLTLTAGTKTLVVPCEAGFYSARHDRYGADAPVAGAAQNAGRSLQAVSPQKPSVSKGSLGRAAGRAVH